MKLSDDLATTLNDMVVTFNNPKGTYIETVQLKDETQIKYNGEFVPLDLFLQALETYKEINRWLYTQVIDEIGEIPTQKN